MITIDFECISYLVKEECGWTEQKEIGGTLGVRSDSIRNVVIYDTTFFFYTFGFKSPYSHPPIENDWICKNSYALVATDNSGGYAGHVFAWSPDSLYRGLGSNTVCEALGWTTEK